MKIILNIWHKQAGRIIQMSLEDAEGKIEEELLGYSIGEKISIQTVSPEFSVLPGIIFLRGKVLDKETLTVKSPGSTTKRLIELAIDVSEITCVGETESSKSVDPSREDGNMSTLIGHSWKSGKVESANETHLRNLQGEMDLGPGLGGNS